MITPTSSITPTTTAASTSAKAATDANASQDRFLKLLVAQLNNQDPMNPMDNAQMTSQMAQINTVTGIQQVNATLQSMAEQFAGMQVLQGSSMVGRNVLVEGNTLTRSNGVASGAIDLQGSADSVKIEIVSPGGQVLDTLNLGAKDAGRHTFDWNATNYQGTGEPSYRVTATQGANTVSNTALVRDTVTSISSENGVMTVQLKGHGATAYSNVKAIL